MIAALLVTITTAPPVLVPLAYEPLKLGTVSASGWLLIQLKQQAATLSGHLDLFWPDVQQSIWTGGTHDHTGAGHERGPYWLNGIVPLSAMLNASGVKTFGLNAPNVHAQMEKWVWYILAHQNKTTGWLGPDDGLGGRGNTYWSAWNVVHALLQYADAHAGEATADVVHAAILAHVKEAYRRQQAVPMTSWSKTRWQDWVLLLHWLWDTAPQGHEAMLRDAGELTWHQRWDWAKYYRLDSNDAGEASAEVAREGEASAEGDSSVAEGARAPRAPFVHTLPDRAVPAWTMYDHGVNNAQGTKWAAVWYRQSGDPKLLTYTRKMLEMQREWHGQPHGERISRPHVACLSFACFSSLPCLVLHNSLLLARLPPVDTAPIYEATSHMWMHAGLFAADECLGGRELNRGIELCAVVEQMYSIEVAFKVTGAPREHAWRAWGFAKKRGLRSRVCVGVRVCACVCAWASVCELTCVRACVCLSSPLLTGELRLLDDLERIAFNALPGTMTADMWQHQYLQQANEISACKANPHVWQSDGPDSTLFGACGGRPEP